MRSLKQRLMVTDLSKLHQKFTVSLEVPQPDVDFGSFPKPGFSGHTSYAPTKRQHLGHLVLLGLRLK